MGQQWYTVQPTSFPGLHWVSRSLLAKSEAVFQNIQYILARFIPWFGSLGTKAGQFYSLSPFMKRKAFGFFLDVLFIMLSWQMICYKKINKSILVNVSLPTPDCWQVHKPADLSRRGYGAWRLEGKCSRRVAHINSFSWAKKENNSMSSWYQRVWF